MSKNISIILFTFLFLGCQSKGQNKDNLQDNLKKIAINGLKTTDYKIIERFRNDTIIKFEFDLKLEYSQKDWLNILKYYPELFNADYEDIDANYYEAVGKFRFYQTEESVFNKMRSTFTSEVGKDDFYMLYGYFQRKTKNDSIKFQEPRRKLKELYWNINELYTAFNNGGAYYGHQDKRIIGYAEYSVSLFDYYNRFSEGTKNIEKLKFAYINSLKDEVSYQINNDLSLSQTEIKDKINKILPIVNKIEGLITNYFYLREAQKFHYSHYH